MAAAQLAAEPLMGPSFRARVQGMGGREVELDVALSSTVFDLKLRIDEAWSIPSECQCLVMGARQLRDDDVLGDFCWEGMQVLLTLVVTMASWEAHMSSTNPEERHDCLPGVIKCALKGGESVQAAAIPMAIAALADGDLSVRQDAWQMISDVEGTRGTVADARAIASACEQLNDPAEAVRAAATMVLGAVAPRGDAHVAEALKARLDDPSPGVRSVALRALAEVMQTADQRTIFALSMRLQDPEPCVGNAAVLALGRLAAGDDFALLAANSCLEHPELRVRILGIRAMERVAKEGSEPAVGALRTYLADASSSVRISALSALAKLAKSGDAETVAGMCRCLADADRGVRFCAVDAVVQVAAKGDGQAIAALRKCLRDPDLHVRTRARTALLGVGYDAF